MKYADEKEGQRDFYNRFLPAIDSALSIDEILLDNNDGVVNGNLLEFKLNVKDLNAVLFQCIKYLSALRIKGKPVPANIHIIDLNEGISWCYKSEPYLSDIEKVYFGGASKGNAGFVGGEAIERLKYNENQSDALRLIKLLKENNFTKIHIDENCIVGWATAFYREVPNARKEDFIGDDTGAHKTIGEIRKPQHFKDYIYPYSGGSNIKFKHLMDRLNDFIQKKNLGAFYTPELYAKKSIELVRKAIERVPKGNDYIILDRCAGTGNLEQYLSDDELSHCILSTIEYYEYKVLQERLGSKVRAIIPPVETEDTFVEGGLVNGADALSKEYIENPIIAEYIDNPKCSVILFENPPYAETTSVEYQKLKKGKSSSVWKSSFVVKEMKKIVHGTVSNDLGNAFIWSGFEYYLRQSTDSYIVYSPVKYWKAQHLVNKEFLGGFAFNRRHFHTNIDACIMVALWGNNDSDIKEFEIDAYDIIDEKLVQQNVLPIKKLSISAFSKKYYDKRIFEDDSEDGIVVSLNGDEIPPNKSYRVKPIRNKNIVGYMVVMQSGFDNPDLNLGLTTVGRYDGNGFYLRYDNYLEKLPMFCAGRYITYNREWTERTRIMKSSDGANKYFKAISTGKIKPYLLKCLLFTCLEMQNHMRSINGSDGRFYRNELCLDTTNGETIATRDLKDMVMKESEKALFEQWKTILKYAKQTKNYNPSLTYGVYQIYAELNTSHKDEKTGATIYDYKELNSALKTLKELVKQYYNSEIVPTLFEYEFLK